MSRLKPAEERECMERLINSLIPRGEIDAGTIAATERWGQHLLRQGEPRLASDVFRQLITLAKRCEPSAPSARYYRLLGRAQREVGDFAECQRIYNTGIAIARREGNRVEEELFHIALAVVFRLEGLLDIAEALLRRVLDSPETIGNDDIRSRALLDAGGVVLELAISKRDPSYCMTALQRFSAAESIMIDNDERQRLRIDIARTFAVLGYNRLARELLAPVLRNPCEQRVFYDAVINAMSFAYLASDEQTFDTYRQSLDARSLPGPHRAVYLTTVAEGFRVFRRNEEAEQADLRAQRLAARIKLRQPFEPPLTVLTPAPAGIAAEIRSLLERLERA
jgi:tetratricopeptide (TPR) repeat protein